MLPRVVVITDWSVVREEITRVLRALEPLGAAVAIQHRHPEATPRAFLEEARFLRASSSLPLFVNGRLDVALLVGAHLHLPVDGPSVAQVRPHLPAGAQVSVAVHSQAELPRAVGASFALVSPVFPPGSKPEDTRPPLGPDGFESLANALGCAAFALGGVTPRTLRAFHPKGAAVLSQIWRVNEPRGLVERMIEALD